MSNEISIPIGVLPSEELAPMIGYMRAMSLHLEASGENPDDMRALRRWAGKLEELKDALERSEWSLGDYDNGEAGCENCGRSRLCICPNGKHRCEKCDWSPELKGYVPQND